MIAAVAFRERAQSYLDVSLRTENETVARAYRLLASACEREAVVIEQYALTHAVEPHEG